MLLPEKAGRWRLKARGKQNSIPSRWGDGMAERILGVIPNVRQPKSFGRSDTYTLIVTERRTIFANRLQT